jgi:hypothetical protein
VDHLNRYFLQNTINLALVCADGLALEHPVLEHALRHRAVSQNVSAFAIWFIIKPPPLQKRPIIKNHNALSLDNRWVTILLKLAYIKVTIIHILLFSLFSFAAWSVLAVFIIKHAQLPCFLPGLPVAFEIMPPGFYFLNFYLFELHYE